MIKRLIIVYFVYFFSKSLCLAHGVNYEIIKGGVGVEVKYDDGTPFSYSQVKVYSPFDSKNPFQEGLTDKNGRFLFFPDKKGKWRIIVNDGMGHRIVKNIEIKEGMKIETIAKGWPGWQKLITGIGIIWGLTGLILCFKVRNILKMK